MYYRVRQNLQIFEKTKLADKLATILFTFEDTAEFVFIERYRN